MSNSVIKGNAEMLFEVSWEICNKVGGIYTVMISKAALMNGYYEKYFMIGPYFEDKARVIFTERKPPADFKKIFVGLKKEGIECHYGIWEIKGEPEVILVDYKGIVDKKNELKGMLWNDYLIDSLHSGWEFEEPMLWSYCVGRFLEEVGKANLSKKIVSHFHEWLAGFALLWLKKKRSTVKTVFTTHATMLGRAIAGSGEDLYSMIENMNPEEEAHQHGVYDKFQTERAAAQATDIFTTVSEITGFEAEKILGRKPEVLVLNGLDVGKFPNLEEVSIKHVTSRERIKEFLTYHFFPYYSFDLDHNLVYSILGRYEFKNKGIDVLIKSLGMLNSQLKKENSNRTVTVFFWIPMKARGIKVELLENKNYYKHIKNFVEWNSKKILQKIISDFISLKDPLKSKSLFTKEFLTDMKRDILQFKRVGNPLIVTNYVENENNDAIVRNLLDIGLDNKEDDRVKVIVYPVYLDGTDGLLNLPYYEAIAGCHLGIFPSYYEPWGYTPLETAAMGVPAITTDLAGFGRFIAPKKIKDEGIFILPRFGKTEDEVVYELYRIMYRFSKLDHSERIQNKVVAKQLSMLADWKHLVKHYILAHNMALEGKNA
ncbi:MAG: glycogen/starch synthase [archaeon]